MRRTVFLAALMMLSSGASSMAMSSLPSIGPITHDVFGFGGEVFVRIDPPDEGFEPHNRIIGAGYQLLWGSLDGGQIGGEAGIAARLGDRNSMELWGGIVGRYNFDIAGLRIAPALTFGLSAVTDTMAGGETRRVQQYDGDGSVLFYLGPEISLGLTDHPEFDVFARLHHRSGAWGTLGEVHGAADVMAVGLRYHF